MALVDFYWIHAQFFYLFLKYATVHFLTWPKLIGPGMDSTQTKLNQLESSPGVSELELNKGAGALDLLLEISCL